MDQTLEHLRREHTPEAIARRLGASANHSYLRDFVYGAIDGAVTTFAVVCGVAGAALPPSIIIVLGIANLIADGFSMAASNFLGTRAEAQLLARIRRLEEHQIDTYPQGEEEEIRQLIRQKGFDGAELERAVQIITSDRQRWLEMMLTEEHGLSLQPVRPWRAAATTFVAFLVIGLLPLLGYLAQLAAPTYVTEPFAWSIATTAAAFAIVGWIKSRFVDQPGYLSALETLLVGGAAASLAYMAGMLLRGLV